MEIYNSLKQRRWALSLPFPPPHRLLIFQVVHLSGFVVHTPFNYLQFKGISLQGT